MRKRTSIVWNVPIEQLVEVVKNSNSLTEVLKYIGLYNKGGNINTLKRRLNEEEIDYSHIQMGSNSNKGKTFPCRKKIPLEKVMVENSTYNRGHLKNRLLKNGMLENKCKICGQLPIHNNQKLVMVLDHENGISNDHREENLRLLCPNCNSQQLTFAGKKNKKKYYCDKCGKIRKDKHSKLCKNCYHINRRKVKNRPAQEQLLKDISELGYCGVGRKYNVSDNTIRKWKK